jgi:nucleotide-binding universal stress UspA family protein
MKTILVPAEDHDSMAAVLETALLVARRFDSYVEGFAVQPAASELVALDPLSSLTMPQVVDGDAQVERDLRQRFESFMASSGVPSAPPPVPVAPPYPPATLPSPGRGGGLGRGAGEGREGVSYAWMRPGGEFDPFIGSYGRVFDLIVLGRPGRAPQNPRMAPLEAALFESGRPVLIAPPTPPTQLGRNVLVAWNGSTEQARTNAFAMPLLRGADQVTVLTVEGGMTPGPTGDEATLHLTRNGVPAVALTVAPAGRTTGEAILDHARARGCDLLVKGAYAQSRLRQMIFGGATRHILAHATLPVLMAH